MMGWLRLRRVSHTMKFSIVAAVVVPLILNGVLLSTYFLYDRTRDVFQGLEKHGTLLAHHLAASSEYALITGNTTYLDEIVENLIKDDQVHSAAIVDNQGHVLIKRQRSVSEVVTAEGLVEFVAPVYLQREESPAFSLVEGEDSSTSSGDSTNTRQLGRALVSLSTATARAEQALVIRYGVLLGVLSLLVAALVGIRLSDRVSRRIEAIKSAIRRIRAGRYDQPVAQTSRDSDEFAALAADVDALAAELSETKEQVQRHMADLTEARQNAEALVEARTKDLAQARDEAVNANDDNRKLIKEMNRMLEQERQYLAREIHDQLNALLVTIRLGLQRLQKNLPKVDPADPNLLESQVRIGEMLERVTEGYTLARQIIHRLRPEVIDAIGLKGALEEMVQGYNRMHPSCQFDLSFAPDAGEFGDEGNIAVYRIVQEALSNVAKHANATQVHIVIERQKHEGGEVECISIEDNGAGFDVQRAATGIGILSMRERARGLGGVLEISSDVSQGTCVRAIVPVSPRKGPVE